MNISEMLIWYRDRLREGLTGEEMEDLLDEEIAKEEPELEFED